MRSISAKVTADISVLRREMRTGGDEVRKLGKVVSDTSRKSSGDFDAMGKRALALELQMAATRKATEELIVAFAKTGDTTLLKRIDDQKKALRELQAVRNLLPSSDEIDRAGQSMGKQLAAAVASRVSQALPRALSGGSGAAGAAIAAAPFIATLTATLSAAAAGAIMGGIGIGGVAGGLAIASRNPEVKASAKSLSTFIGDQLEEAAQPFVPATQKAIAQARADFVGLRGDLDEIFAKSAPFLGELETGGAGFTDAILGELPDILEAAAPVMDVISQELPELGQAFGELLSGLADNGPEAASALEMVFDIMEDGIKVVGTVINGMTEFYGFLAKNGFLGGEVQQKYEQYAAAQKVAADAAIEGAGAADQAAEALQRQREAAKALSDQLRADADPVFAFLNAQERLKTAQGEVAEATKKHGRSSAEAQSKLRGLAEAALDLQFAAGQLGENFDGKMTPALRATLRAAGATKGQINQLARQFEIAKAAGLDFARDYKARLFVEVVEQQVSNASSAAKRALAATRAELARGKRHGGIDTPVAMAAGGTMSAGIYPASNPPLVRYAEPETGGEAYIPKRGDRGRNLAILAEVASWPSVNASVVPMARGGVAMARGGYVNVAPTSTTTTRSGSRLDSASAALEARNAVVSLNTALRENGRSFSESTKKGRENRAALMQGIQAAQSAARAKFDETGSVRLANREYDEYIRRLKDVLGQQKASSSLLNSLAARPQYDTAEPAKPKNSTGNIAFVRSLIDRNDATSTARTFFNSGWGTPKFNTGTSFGKDNYRALFDFLDSAQGAAQARFSQTGNARSATRLYNSSLGSLRSILTQAGVPKKEIDRLLNSYGRITLGNRDGGVYEHMADGGLSQAHIAAGGPTRYAYAEPSTGGELFAPKRGNLAKTRQEVSWAVSNWWGGDVAWQGGPGSGRGSGGAMTIRLVVDAAELAGALSTVVDEQLGALADASIHQTTA